MSFNYVDPRTKEEKKLGGGMLEDLLKRSRDDVLHIVDFFQLFNNLSNPSFDKTGFYKMLIAGPHRS